MAIPLALMLTALGAATGAAGSAMKKENLAKGMAKGALLGAGVGAGATYGPGLFSKLFGGTGGATLAANSVPAAAGPVGQALTPNGLQGSGFSLPGVAPTVSNVPAQKTVMRNLAGLLPLLNMGPGNQQLPPFQALPNESVGVPQMPLPLIGDFYRGF